MRNWPRLESGRVMERLNMALGPCVINPRRKRDGQLENSAAKVGIGVSRGRSVFPSRGDVQALRQREDAGSGLLPHEYRQLAKGAQENVPQHSDASSSPSIGMCPWCGEPLHPG